MLICMYSVTIDQINSRYHRLIILTGTVDVGHSAKEHRSRRQWRRKNASARCHNMKKIVRLCVGILEWIRKRRVTRWRRKELQVCVWWYGKSLIMYKKTGEWFYVRMILCARRKAAYVCEDSWMSVCVSVWVYVYMVVEDSECETFSIENVRRWLDECMWSWMSVCVNVWVYVNDCMWR